MKGPHLRRRLTEKLVIQVVGCNRDSCCEGEVEKALRVRSRGQTVARGAMGVDGVREGLAGECGEGSGNIPFHMLVSCPLCTPFLGPTFGSGDE